MFDITDEGSTIEEYLGDVSTTLTREDHKVIPGMDRVNEYKTPTATTTMLTKDIDGEKGKRTGITEQWLEC
eukprot:2159360-Ditylum_brightwellii.AAC.1